MDRKDPNRDRGDRDPRAAQAAREVGRTEVEHWVSWVLLLGFVALLLAGALPELGRGTHSAFGGMGPLATLGRSLGSTPSTWAAEGPSAANGSIQKGLQEVEEGLEQSSWTVDRVLPPVQGLLAGSLGWSSERVVPGREGWLFYRPAVELLTGPGFVVGGPVSALAALSRDLEAWGSRLLVVPIPVKAALHSERLSRASSPAPAEPLTSSSWQEFLDRLEVEGIAVLDPGPVLASLRHRSGEPVFLATDSHWRPGAVAETARELASWIEKNAGPLGGEVLPYGTRQLAVVGEGDLSRMLRQEGRVPSEEVSVSQVVGPDGGLWQAQRGASVLIVGDSFTNVYSRADLGWGEAAGLGAQLSAQLSRAVDVVALNDGGARGSRQELARDPDLESRLKNARVVVYAFSSRELLHGDWTPLALPPPNEGRSLPGLRGGVRILGRVAEVAPLPAPGATPYREILRAVLVEVLEGEAGADRVVVYAWGLRDGRPAGGSLLVPGDEIEAELQLWGEVESRYGSLQRQELGDPELLWLPAFFSEEVKRR